MVHRKTIVILVILTIVIGYYYLFELKLNKIYTEKKDKTKKVLTLNKDEINSIEIKYETENFVCLKQDTSWIVKPVAPGVTISPAIEYKGDEKAILSLISSLTDATIETRITQANPSDYGLNPAKLTVKISGKNNTVTETVLLGDFNPADTQVYAQKQGEPDVILVTRTLFPDLNKKVNDFRDKTIFTVDISQVRKCIVQKDKFRLVFEKNPDSNKWWCTTSTGTKFQCLHYKVPHLLERINEIKVKEFVNERDTNLDFYGLTRPQGKVTVWTGTDGKSTTLLFGKKKDDSLIYVKPDNLPLIYAVDMYRFNDMPNNVDDWRDNLILEFKPETITKIEVKAKDTELVIAKKKEEWKTVLNRGKKLTVGQVRMVYILYECKFKEVLTPVPLKLPEFGLDKPIYTVTIWQNEQKINTLFIAQKNDAYYAYKDKDTLIYTVNEDWVNQFIVAFK